MLLDRRPHLLFIHLPGCPACAAAAPAVAELARRVPTLRVTAVDITTAMLDYPVTVFPSFRLELPDGHADMLPGDKMKEAASPEYLGSWLRDRFAEHAARMTKKGSTNATR